MAGLTLVACSPDDYAGLDANGIPNAADADITMEVDQEINQVTLRLNNKAQYPVWIVDGKSYSTRNPLTKIYANSGDYTIQYRVGNRNGISDGMGEKSFHFNNSIVDFTGYISRLAGSEAEGKQWFIASAEAGHMGCGPSGTDGLEWWSANPNDKASNGVYDDVLTFTPNGAYTYDPGEGGTMYVNKEVKAFAETNGGTAPEDVMVNVGVQQSSYDFTVEGNDVFLVLPSHTQFPYISNDDQWNAPKFKIVDLKPKHMELIYDNGSIAWHFILVTEKAAAQEEFKGFKYDSDCNMFRTAHYTNTYWYAPGWNQIADPVQTVSGSAFTLALPEATTDKWQCQYFFHTDMTTNSSTNYDFSCVFNSTKDHGNVTVKICEETDDGKLYFDEVIQLKAYEDYVFYKSDMPGIDLASVKIVFDFGHSPNDAHVNIRNIVLKDHANDDGTILPGEGGEGGDTPSGTVDWDYNSPANMWKAVDDGSKFEKFGYYFATGSDWQSIPYNEATHSGDTYEIDLPENIGTNQWQAQFHIDTYLTASASKKYNFYLVMEADNDMPQVTFKLTDSGDANFFFEERHDVPAGTFVFKKKGVTLKEGTDASAVRMFFDFGGSPAGTHVKISKIYFEEATEMNYDDADNLWKAVDDGSKFEKFGYYFATGDSWTSIPYNEAAHSGNVYEIDLPENLGVLQWQGQFHIDTYLTASASKQYAFQVVVEADNDLPQMTFKLTDSGDSNFFFEERVDVPGGEQFTFKRTGLTLKEGTDASAIRMFFDFGGSPAGTHVKISKIIFKEM